MSVLFTGETGRVKELTEFSSRLIHGEDGKLLYHEYRHLIESVTATETMQVFDLLIFQGVPFDMIKNNVGKIINLFYRSLKSNVWTKPEERHFLHYLMLENREAEKIMSSVREVIKKLFKDKNNDKTYPVTDLNRHLDKLKEYELHYIKKENILFPLLEKTFPEYRCVQLMWSFHDDFRKVMKKLDSILKQDVPDKNEINTEIGKLFFIVLPIIFREEQIVFPVAVKAIAEESWNEMLEQSLETGWAFGIKPSAASSPGKSLPGLKDLVNLETGFLTPDQIISMIENLPLDITFVDENDEVRYFSGAKHRIFPRAASIIGRKVQNCHPHESVHIVNRIIEAFREGTKDHADFRIRMNGRLIYIRYFALRGEQGDYKGVIEVSQDITGITGLKGEQRLLDWNTETGD